MAKSKATTKGKTATKGKAATKSKPADKLANARKIGERQETITHALSPMEIDKERELVCTLLREIEKTEAEIKNVTATHKARLVELKTRLRGAANVANTAKRDLEITVEEWLNDRNEVIRMRTDTGEIIGNRTARQAELQEELPIDTAAEDDEDDDEDEETETDSDDAPPDFGDTAAEGDA